MNDIELLKLAAKAIGIQYEWHEGLFDALHLTAPDADQIYWNPISSDVDAFKLSVALKVDIHQRVVDPRAVAIAPLCSPKIEKCTDDTRLAATRRAIVRAAAEIGERMP